MNRADPILIQCFEKGVIVHTCNNGHEPVAFVCEECPACGLREEWIDAANELRERLGLRPL
jgi:hypothetical protein